MLKIGIGVFSLALGASLLFLTAPASAELEVISSTVATYQVGRHVADEAVLDIPPGKRLKFRRVGSSETYTLYGPFQGRLRDYRGGSEGSPGPGPGAGGTMSVRPPQH
jgi:hypothetical protein